METVLITGGAGFIGSHACDEAIAKGMRVICADIDTRSGNISHLKDNPNFSIEALDIREPGELNNVFQNSRIDYIIHLAARTGVRPSVIDPSSYIDTNVKGTLNILEAGVKHGIKKVIFASSSSVYGSVKVPFSEDANPSPASPYGVSKLAAEHLCRNYHDLHGLDVVCLRFFTVYGPRGRSDMAPYIFTKNILEGEPITVFGDGSTSRDYTFVTDAIAGIFDSLASDIKFDILNIGGSQAIRLTDFIAVIERVTGKKAVIKNAKLQPGDMKATYADVGRAARMINYRPKVGTEEGMGRFIEWYRSRSR